CDYLGDITLLPGVYRLYGWLQDLLLRQLMGLLPLYPPQKPIRLRDESDQTVSKMIQHEDTALVYLTAAEAAGLVGGNVDAMDSAYIRAGLLVDLGEYDAALLCLERLEGRMDLGLHRETQVRIERLRGEIDVRQGRIERAIEK